MLEKSFGMSLFLLSGILWFVSSENVCGEGVFGSVLCTCALRILADDGDCQK